MSWPQFGRSSSASGRYAALAEKISGSGDGSLKNAKPQSYGTFSHLWPSAITESARPTPSSRCAVDGLAPAKSPNAPSTWSHAP